MDEKKNNVSRPASSAVKKGKKDKNLCENLNYAAKEAFKRLRANVLLALPEEDAEGCRIIGVTSAQPTEGKSTIAINTAFSLAELEKKVLLIDSDMRRPSIHTKLELPQIPGLSNLLSDSNAISAAIKTYHSSEGAISFDIIPAGNPPKNPSEILTSNRMEKLLNALTGAYDYIILDLPPVGAVIDAVSVGKHTDGMIVVVRENNCPVEVFDDCVEQLKFADIPILGFVVNGALEGAGKGYGYKYKYGGYGKYKYY